MTMRSGKMRDRIIGRTSGWPRHRINAMDAMIAKLCAWTAQTGQTVISMAAGDRWQSNAFLFRAAAVTLGLFVHLLLNLVFNNFFRKHWFCNYQLMRIFIFCSNGFPYVFAPVFFTPAFSTPHFQRPHCIGNAAAADAVAVYWSVWCNNYHLLLSRALGRDFRQYIWVYTEYILMDLAVVESNVFLRIVLMRAAHWKIILMTLYMALRVTRQLKELSRDFSSRRRTYNSHNSTGVTTVCTRHNCNQ